METKAPAIIHLTPHFYWPQLEKVGWPVKFDTMGGMQNQIFRLMGYLDSISAHQLILTLKIPGIPKNYKISSTTSIASVRVPVMPIRSRLRGMVDLNLSWFIGVILFVIKNRYDLTRQYNVIHAHCSGVGLPLMAGYLVAKILGFPLVTSIHCSAIATYKPMSHLDRYLHMVNIYIEKKILSRSTQVIFLTAKSLHRCSEYVNNLESKASVISDAIDSDYFSLLQRNNSKEEFCKRYNIPANKPICIYVGRIAREKGWVDIIDIASELKQRYHFLIVGDGNELDVMTKAIERVGLKNAFTFTGFISQEKVPTAMGLATAMILPSRHEELGSVLLEAMTLGLVAIAYNVGGVGTVITHEKDGLLANNTQEMIVYLKKILDLPALRKDLGRNAKIKIRRKFQINKLGRDIYDVYRKALS